MSNYSTIVINGEGYILGIRRQIKLDYFTVCYNRTGSVPVAKDKLFDLCALIGKVDKLTLEDRMFDYYQEQARLDKFHYNSIKKYWFLNFTRLRETNIPSKAYIDKPSESITLEDDEFISEECNAIYDCNLKVLMLQRNIHSLSPSGITEYINKLWDDDSIHIYLRPIPSKSMIEKAQKAAIYRRLQVKFADIDGKNFKLPKKSSLKKIFEDCEKFKGVTAEIIVTMGDNRQGSLDNETVSEVLEEAKKKGASALSKAIVSIKETDDSKVEVIDLFQDNISDYIYVVLEKRVSLASEFVERRMREAFENRKGDLYEIVGGK